MVEPQPPTRVSGATQAGLEAFVAALGQASAITVAVMVVSVDGRTTVAGRVGALTGAADQWVLLGAREQAAVVVAGGQTVRAEGYARLLDEQARARRRARGFTEEPELAVLTRRAGAGLPDGARALTPPPLADGRPDLTTAWGELRSRHPDGLIVCEGGPRLLGQLIQQRLLDQLVLCISPHLAGGANALRLTEGLELPAPALLPMTLLDLARADDFVFLRYAAAP